MLNAAVVPRNPRQLDANTSMALPPGGRLSACFSSLRSCFEGYAQGLTNGGESCTRFSTIPGTAAGQIWLNGIVTPEEIKAARDNRKALAGAYKQLLEEISAILFRYDPIEINFEDNTDEYEAEAGTILPRLRADMTADEATSIVHEEFVRWFSDLDAGPEGKYCSIATEILAAYRQHGWR
jgi:hypothetical protein